MTRTKTKTTNPDAENSTFAGGSTLVQIPESAHSESPNLLIEEDLNADPTPHPLPPQTETGKMGWGMNDDGSREWRLPTDEEFIDDDGYLKNRLFWKPKKRRRALSKLDTRQDIQREMTRLYADHHHRRISGNEFTKAVYALTCIAQIAGAGGKR